MPTGHTANSHRQLPVKRVFSSIVDSIQVSRHSGIHGNVVTWVTWRWRRSIDWL